jgi:small-conductance mechanosensitive channel
MLASLGLTAFLVSPTQAQQNPQSQPSAAPPTKTPQAAQTPPAQQPPAAQQNTNPANTPQADTSSTDDRDQAVLRHLNAVLRYYHDAQAPIQKVGEPSDLIYRDQAAGLAAQIAGLAFDSARAKAALTARSPAATAPPSASQTTSPAATNPSDDDPDAPSDTQTEAQKLQSTRDAVAQRIAALKAQDEALDKQLESARARDIPALEQEREETQGELELQKAMSDALSRITNVPGASHDSGFLAQINQLQRSAPGIAAGKPTTVAPTLENLGSARGAGVTSQAQVLFQLLGTRQSIDQLIAQAGQLQQQATDLRNPLIDKLRKTIAQGEALSRQTPAVVPSPSGSSPAHSPSAQKATLAVTAAELVATRKNYDALTAAFKVISSASVPLSQEILAIEQSQASLQAWRRAVNEEYTSILRSLLLRVLSIAIALGFIFALGEIWRRATTRYVHDIRRRRQLLVIRRLVVGFLSGLVMIFGLVTQFSSLATFAGFITAGLAVGLQTILLSVAAYFFIIGRYGIKVGDRITVAGVTGDVAEVGLVRFYVLELAGNGTDLYPSGRVAVFSNAVLFQAGTPLYKQMPGTEYLWHEMTVKLAPDSDYRPAVEAMRKSVESVYAEYRQQIERQHQALESWMDTSLDIPNIQSTLQLVDGGLQFWVRFPVLIKESAAIDDRMTQSVLNAITANPGIKAAISASPVIKAAVKG